MFEIYRRFLVDHVFSAKSLGNLVGLWSPSAQRSPAKSQSPDHNISLTVQPQMVGNLATTHEIALQAQVQRDRFDFARKSYRHWTEIRFPGVAGPARDEPIAVAVLARRRHRRSYQRRLKGFISRLRWRCAPLRLNATYLPTFSQNTIQELHRQCFSNRWLADSR